MIIKECPELKTGWEVDLTRLPRYIRIPHSCRERECVCVYVCVCVWEREREREWPTLALNNQWEVSECDSWRMYTSPQINYKRWLQMSFEQIRENLRSVPIQDQNAHVQNWATWQENITEPGKGGVQRPRSKDVVLVLPRNSTLCITSIIYVYLGWVLLCKCVCLVF